MALEELNAQICVCKKCRLWEGAKQAVPGEGPDAPRLMLVGQNPGKEEDETGRPFVGRAGKFLNSVLAQNGLDRSQIFITNIVKHLTPRNRKPCPDELEACLPYLVNQLVVIKPEIVMLMGKVAWQTPRPSGIKFVETVHPSAAMRFTKMRKKFVDDFKLLKKQMQ